MTARMPEVGKIYRSKESGYDYLCEFFGLEAGVALMICLHNKSWSKIYFTDLFWERFEELPDSPHSSPQKEELDEGLEQSKRGETHDLGSFAKYAEEGSEEQVSSVEKALEELKREIALCGGGMNPSPQTKEEKKCTEIFFYFLGKAQNLVEALEAKSSELTVSNYLACQRGYEAGLEAGRTEKRKFKLEGFSAICFHCKKDLIQDERGLFKADCGCKDYVDLADMSKPEPKIDAKEGYSETAKVTPEMVKFLRKWDKPKAYFMNENGLQEFPLESGVKSIWKDVTELPTDEKLSVIVELGSGEKCFANFQRGFGFCETNGTRIRPGQGFSPREVRYCTLTDFINDHESLKRRTEKLEKMMDSVVNTLFASGKITEADKEWARVKVLEEGRR